MRHQLHLHTLPNYHSPVITEDLYSEMQRISRNRNNGETYSIEVVSDDGQLTLYRFKMWSPGILRFIGQMSVRHRYILASVFETEFRETKVGRFAFYPNDHERPVMVKREVGHGKITFVLSLAN